MGKKEEKNIKEIINLIKKIYGENFNKYITTIVFTFIMKKLDNISLSKMERYVEKSKKILESAN